MTTIAIFALIIGCTVLWTQVKDLQARILVLEYGPPVFDERSLVAAAPEPMPEPQIVERASAFPAPVPEYVVSDEPEPEPAPHPVPADEPVAARGFGFEDIFGRRLPIWRAA